MSGSTSQFFSLWSRKQHFWYAEILYFTLYRLCSYLHGVVTINNHLYLTNCIYMQLISYQDVHNNQSILNKLHLKYFYENLT